MGILQKQLQNLSPSSGEIDFRKNQFFLDDFNIIKNDLDPFQFIYYNPSPVDIADTYNLSTNPKSERLFRRILFYAGNENLITMYLNGKKQNIKYENDKLIFESLIIIESLADFRLGFASFWEQNQTDFEIPSGGQGVFFQYDTDVDTFIQVCFIQSGTLNKSPTTINPSDLLGNFFKFRIEIYCIYNTETEILENKVKFILNTEEIIINLPDEFISSTLDGYSNHPLEKIIYQFGLKNGSSITSDPLFWIDYHFDNFIYENGR